MSSSGGGGVGGGAVGGGSISGTTPATLLANVITAGQVVQVIINVLKSDSILAAISIPGVGVSIGPDQQLVGTLGGIVLNLLNP